jgi:hypothetical protein
VRIDVRTANRERTEHADFGPLRLEQGQSYLFLLGPGRTLSPQRPPVHVLVRGVRGARPLPAEGSAAVLDVVERLVAIHDLGDHALTWEAMTELLSEERHVLVEIALQQFVKFRQGGPELVEAVRRLLAHTDPEIRRLSSELLGQLAGRHAAIVLGSAGAVRDDLAARARSDSEPSVRIAAATALGTFDGPAVDEVLEEMAATDPSQEVRYVAETLIYDRRTRPSASPGGSH